ncbi:hypothetical protein [Lysobacter antibioticus]|uniref:hypothetical protein n=1 Tax=Lysobacter antibioticus TaxID=84531 RepID=UPI000716677E|nr:hypothetical protein [Lysobacter antibioticus]
MNLPRFLIVPLTVALAACGASQSDSPFKELEGASQNAVAAAPPVGATATASTPAAAAPAATAAAACPAQGFDDFLKAYAGDAQTKTRFTLPTVKVVDLVDVGEDTQQRTEQVPGKDYTGFNLAYRDDGFHVVDSAGAVDPKPVAVEVKAEAAEAYFVRYQYGMSEGNSYRFVRRDGCWFLAEDPEPSAP